MFRLIFTGIAVFRSLTSSLSAGFINMNVNPKEAMKTTNSTNAFKYKPTFKKNSKGIRTPPTIIADNKLFQRFAGSGMLAFL
jgi:hypothetical protein